MNIVWDWAGTLADDQELTWRLTDEIVRRFGGGPVDFSAYKREFTLPAAGFYRARCPDVPFSEIEAAFAALCRSRYPADARLWPGVKAGLACGACRHRFFLFSTLDQSMLEGTLESLQLRHLFQAVRGSVTDKAAALPGLLTEWGLVPDETALVGDTPHDIAAARVAGVQGLAVTYGYTAATEMAKAAPEDSFDSFAAVLRHLDKLACAESRHFPVLTVGGVVYDADGMILLIRTRKWSGLLGIPGGKVEYGETLEAAFTREVREETGLEIGGITFVLNQDCIEHPEFYRPRHFLLVNFRAVTAGSAPPVRLNHEAQEYLWSDPRKALSLDLNGPTRVLVEKVLAEGDV